MESADAKSPEASPLIEVDLQTDKSEDVSGRSPSKTISEQFAKKVCCTFRVRLVAIILLLLFQIPIFAYYYRTSYNLEFGNLPSGMNPMKIWDNYVYGSHEVKENPTSTQTYLNPHLSKALPVTTRANKNYWITKVKVINSSTQGNNVEQGNVELTTHKSTTTVSVTTSTLKTTIATSPATTSTESTMPLCPETPPALMGRLTISFNAAPDTFEKTLSENPQLTDGGHGKPPDCLARHKVAIIIPYRDRMEHLRYFVEYMHPILSRQQVDYQIFIINQFGHGQFNRAKLMNIGFIESQKIYPFNCFAYHDVDLILEDDRSLYWCSDRPRHMSAGVDKFNYVLPYSSIFGGVTLLSKKQMDDINGFSNEFWGWGGEDDDVFNRLRIKNYKIVRYPMEIARYKMIRHSREKGNAPNPKRFDLIRKTHLTYMKDGINSIKYKVISTEFHPTYTNITVDVFGPP